MDYGYEIHLGGHIRFVLMDTHVSKMGNGRRLHCHYFGIEMGQTGCICPLSALAGGSVDLQASL